MSQHDHLYSTTATAWWGWCDHCGVPFNNHNISCPKLATIAPQHAVDCRCPTCRPDIHITHPDTLVCERTGCGQRN